jgi:hypothetical protein
MAVTAELWPSLSTMDSLNTMAPKCPDASLANMKSTKKLLGVGAIVGGLFAGCWAHGATSVVLTGTSLVPAAEGQVSLSGGADANRTLRVTVHHLAQPGDLNPQTVNPNVHQPAAPQNYVVWLQPMNDNNPPQSIGVLVPDKNLDADLTTTTSQRQFYIFVTAEPSATPNSPTGERLLQATVRE